ncbi:hypothetical protein HMI55_005551, partial [Coelomomyces lativittatus]
MQHTELAHLKPETYAGILAIIGGAIPVKETKSNQFMTVILLLDPTQPDYQKAFKLNLFRKRREEIPMTELKERRILYINPIYIQTYQGDLQGLCTARDTPQLSILSFTSFMNQPIRHSTPTWQ